jgi:L-threonylcarbamoyladenylate synthase
MQRLSLSESGLEACLAAASKVLDAGGLVIGPTDTLYGVFAAWDNPQAVERLYALKGRDQEKRLLVLVADRRMAEKISAILLPAALMQYWPGPLTAILPVDQHPLGWSTQAIRLPDHDFSRGLAKAIGKPVYAPSANSEGKPPATSCDQAEAIFGSQVDLYIDGGPAESDAPSTILSLIGTPSLVRRGILELSLEDFV